MNKGALFIIFLGVLLLLNNFGVISWDIWETLWRFWPLLLILWGVELTFGKTKTGRLISTLILAVGALFLLYLIFQGTMEPRWIDEDTLEDEFNPTLIIPTRLDYTDTAPKLQDI